MEVDITTYQPVILDVLKKMKVPKNEREDMTQECYVALLEKHKHLKHGVEIGDGNNYAATICRSRIGDVLRRQTQAKKGRNNPKPHFDSMSDPRTLRRVLKIGEPVIDDDPNATPEEMEKAILSLDFDEYMVIYELFVLGKTQDTVAKDLGISPRTVWTRSQKGIISLKKYFGVEIPDEL
jgi:RNA polymerase sigma factor (sigma-70 family)